MHPLLPALIPFALGIASSGYLGLSYLALALILTGTLIPPVISLKRGLGDKAFYASIAPFFFFLGLLSITPYKSPDLPLNHISRFIRGGESEDPVSAIGTVMDGVIATEPEYALGKTRFNVEARAVLSAGHLKPATGMVMVMVDGDAPPYGYGDIVRLVARLKEPLRYGNPGEFDYAGRLKMQGIHAVASVKDKRFIARLGAPSAGLLRGIGGLRKGLREFIGSSSAKNKEELKALLIGEKRGISRAVLDRFASTGTSHILAISGLHMGIVALFSFRFFFFLFKRSERLMLLLNAKKASMLLAVAPVMLYGALSGFPVSANRALIMAVVFILAYCVDRAGTL
jgi:competence protein ComEC